MGKKVLIFANKDGGLYSFRKELLQKLISEGHEVYCSFPFAEKTELIKELGCNCIDTKVSRRGTNPIEDLKLLFRYLKLLKKLKPDVVLTYTIKPNVYGGLACTLKRIPYIANVTGLGTAVQNSGLMQKLTLLLYKIGLWKAKMVFFQNSENQKFMLRHKIIRGENDLLPGSGVNLEQHCFEEYPESDQNIVLLTIGRIMRDKGTNEILQAAKIIKAEYPNVTFRFIGAHDGNCKENFENAVRKGIIEHLGKQPQVHTFIAESHATLHASYHEGMSNVLLETASSGRPVIATNVPGCRETYDDGVSGISFEPKNVDDMVRAVKTFLSLTNEQKAQMGKAGRLKMEKEFNRNIIINKYLKIIENL